MVTWSAVRGSGMTGRQGVVSTLAAVEREVSPLDVVARGKSARAESEEWKKRLRRLDKADIVGLGKKHNFIQPLTEYTAL